MWSWCSLRRRRVRAALPYAAQQPRRGGRQQQAWSRWPGTRTGERNGGLRSRGASPQAGKPRRDGGRDWSAWIALRSIAAVLGELTGGERG